MDGPPFALDGASPPWLGLSVCSHLPWLTDHGVYLTLRLVAALGCSLRRVLLDVPQTT